MSGIQEAVQSLPASASASRVAGGLSVVAEGSPEAAGKRSASALSKVAWIPQRDLGQAEWLATGRRLGAIGRCSQWWIGDWIRYGSARWGEKYAEAARITGYDVASLRNMAWVASQFDLSLRSDKLTWSHHVLLAPLETEDKRFWLARAQEERLSVADLRIELRGRRQGGAASSRPRGEEKEVDLSVVCPNCGHEMRSTQG
jgi:hypothetical protein